MVSHPCGKERRKDGATGDWLLVIEVLICGLCLADADRFAVVRPGGRDFAIRSEKKDVMGMKLMKDEWLRMRRGSSWFPALAAKDAGPSPAGGPGTPMGHPAKGAARGIAVWLLAMGLAAMAWTQAVSTTTVQGTTYLANGQPGAGTVAISWPSFTTAAGQAVAADSTTVKIGPDGFVSVNLAPNVGATPAGEYYTAVFYMSDGSTSTQYWVVPAAAQATLAQVQAKLMPAAQAVQTVSKAYVDQAIAELNQSGMTASGGTLSGPLYLSSDPTQPLQAADKHYVDTQVATAVPLAGGNMTGALTTPAVNGVQAPTATSAQTTLQAAMNAAGTNGAMVIPPTYAGTDTFTNANGVRVTDLRTSGAQQTERSVKEFGAVCDGVTDDTNALQAALSYANAHGVALTIPQGTCKTRTLSWKGESIGGLGKQVSTLMGFPGQDVLASGPDATNMLSNTRLHDLTIYVDQSADVSCTPAEGRAAAGSCQTSRPMEMNSVLSPGGNGLTGTAGTGAAWWVGNCGIAMQAATGAGGNGLRVAEIENVEIAATGVDPMAAQYGGAHSTHTCGMYLAQWPQWSEFRNIDVRGVNTGIAIPALPVTAPAGLNADSNRWQNVTIQATHAFTAAAGSNNVLDNVVALASNSAATGEPPTGLVLDLNGNAQGWTVRNAVVMPAWYAVQPALTVTTTGGAVTAVTVGSDHGLGWDPYGTSVPVAFSGSCTAQATAAVSANGSIGSVNGDAGRSGLLRDDNSEPERGGNVGYGSAGQSDRRAEYDVLRRKSVEGQRRIHIVERDEFRELRDAVGWRRRDAARWRHLRCAGGEQQSWERISSGSVSRRGYWREDPGVRERGECQLRRNVRCAEFYRQSDDGVEPDDRDGKRGSAAAVRDDYDGEPGCGDGGNAECVVARVRTARRDSGERKHRRNGVRVLGRERNGAGGRSDLRDGYAGFPPG